MDYTDMRRYDPSIIVQPLFNAVLLENTLYKYKIKENVRC